MSAQITFPIALPFKGEKKKKHNNFFFILQRFFLGLAGFVVYTFSTTNFMLLSGYSL